MSMLIAVNYVM